MSEHTSGPWRVDKRPKSRAYISAEHCVVAQVFALIHQDANARLIAAAPTMAEYIEKKAADGDTEAQAILESIRD